MYIARKLILPLALTFVAPLASATSCGDGLQSGASAVVCSQEEVYSSFQLDFFTNYFDDVKTAGAIEFLPFVKILASKSVIEKSKEFRPDVNATRAEVLVMLMRSLDSKAPDWRGTAEIKYIDAYPFQDVPSGDPFYYYANDALRYGFITPNSRFRPNDPISRQEFAKLIFKAMKVAYPNKEDPASAVPFNDHSNIDSGLVFYVYALRAYGIVSGYSDGTFHPRENIKRAHVAKIIAKTFFSQESDMRFSQQVDYQKVVSEDEKIAEQFALAFIKKAKSDLPFFPDFITGDSGFDRAVKAAMLATLSYIRSPKRGLKKELLDELIKNYFGDATGIVGKMASQFNGNGFWNAIKSGARPSAMANYAIIVFDLFADVAASGSRDFLASKGDAVRGQVIWSQIKLFQLSMDMLAGGATSNNPVLGATIGALGVTYDGLKESAGLITEWAGAGYSALYAAKRLEQLTYCSDKVVNPEINLYIDAIINNKDTNIPTEEDIRSKQIANLAKSCMKSDFDIFMDSDQNDVWGDFQVQRFLMKAIPLVLDNQCKSSQDLCG